jgi:hypothetical protein
MITHCQTPLSDNGKLDVKYRSNVRCALEKDGPSMPADDPVRNGHTQTGASWFGGKERIENTLVQYLLDFNAMEFIYRQSSC